MAPAVGAPAPLEELDGRIARETQRPWLTLAPVIAAFLALTTLVTGPWIVGRRLAELRHEIIDVTVRARQLESDIEDALVLELAARTEPALAPQYGEVVSTERTREQALDSLAPHLGRDVANDIARLRRLIGKWYATRTDANDAPVSAAEIVATAERLDTALAIRGLQQSARAESLESWDVVLPTILAPILIITVLAVYWTGQRMMALVNEAQQSRLALRRVSEQKVALLRGLTHDLKNTLWAAGGYAHLLKHEIVGPLTPKQRDQVTRIGRLIDQAVGTVRDSLEIAQADAGVLPVRRERVDVSPLLNDAASDYLAAAEAARLTLSVEIADHLPVIETDPSLVSKIVGNLLSNAIKYTPAGGQVWLRASTRETPRSLPAGAWVVVDVCDTGPGVPPTLREQIFDEFFRSPMARATAPGAGVGLAMSRRVARAIGGEITVDGEDGQGATFTLWLPA